MFNKITLQFFTWANRIKPAQEEIIRLRTTIGIMASAMGIFFSLVLGIPVYLYGEPQAGWTFFILAAWLFIGTILFIKSRSSLAFWVYFNFIGLIITNFAATVLLGGVQDSGMLIIWILITPLLSPILSSPRHTVYWAVLFLVLVVAASYLADALGQVNTLPANMQNGMVLFNVCGISVFVLVIVQLFVIQRNQYQEQSDTLLLNILPREIANILRNENRVIADAFEGASILFADVVNFTPMSASMSPVELVNLLNEVFSRFDVLADKHKLEKIKNDWRLLHGGQRNPAGARRPCPGRHSNGIGDSGLCKRSRFQWANTRLSDRHQFWSRNCRGDRAEKVCLRSLGRCREYGQPYGIARHEQRDSNHAQYL